MAYYTMSCDAIVSSAKCVAGAFFQVNCGGKADSMRDDENTRTFCHSL